MTKSQKRNEAIAILKGVARDIARATDLLSKKDAAALKDFHQAYIRAHAGIRNLEGK